MSHNLADLKAARNAALAAYFVARDAADNAKAAYLAARDSLNAARLADLDARLGASSGASFLAARFTGQADHAATFEQAFGALIVAIDRANFHEGDEVSRLDALAFAFDKLPAAAPDRTADLLLKTEALAALVLFAAEELRASDERYLLTDRLDLELTASWRARDALTLALDRLTALDGGRERP